MITLKIAAIVCGIPLGFWLGARVFGIAKEWLKYGFKKLKPPKRNED